MNQNGQNQSVNEVSAQENIPRGLVTFQNTDELAVAIVLKNSTYFPLLDFNKWVAWSAVREYFPMPSEIFPFSAHGFGFTFNNPGKGYDFGGLFTFKIDETRFVVSYGVWEGHNRFGLAFLPLNNPVDADLIHEADWSAAAEVCIYRQESIEESDIDAHLEFGSISAEAKMTKGRKAVLTIKIKAI